MLLRLRPLLRAVLLSHSARFMYGGMLRVLALGCGAARSRPPVLGAGLGFIGGAMSLCAQPRCGTHTPPLVRLVGVEPPDPRVNKVVRNLCPRGKERLELRHKDVGCCGMRQGGHGEELLRVDVLEAFPGGCQQPARGCGGVDAVDRPEFLVVKGVRVPSLW